VRKVERVVGDAFSTIKEINMKCLRKNAMSRLQFLFISWGALVLIGACAAVPDQEDWIKIGRTTRDEVVERYGQPDLVMVAEGGETAIYRPSDRGRSATKVEIPRVQAGPLGTSTVKMEPINRGSGTRSTSGSLQERPEQELRIRYNTQGIVQELIR
jgi:hypothetical protein